MVHPQDVKVGAVFRYAPEGRKTAHPVRIEDVPTQRDDGDWVCNARSLWTGLPVQAELKALSVGR